MESEQNKKMDDTFISLIYSSLLFIPIAKNSEIFKQNLILKYCIFYFLLITTVFFCFGIFNPITENLLSWTVKNGLVYFLYNMFDSLLLYIIVCIIYQESNFTKVFAIILYSCAGTDLINILLIYLKNINILFSKGRSLEDIGYEDYPIPLGTVGLLTILAFIRFFLDCFINVKRNMRLYKKLEVD